MAKVVFRHKSLKALAELEPLNATRLEERIYKKILVGGQDFRPDNASEHQEGIELLGKLFMIHQEFMKEAGEWEDMFGEYMESTFKLNSSTGQFFTPMEVVRLMVKMNFADVDCTLPEPQRICDPCCGAGRFMLGIAEHYATECGAFNFLIVNVDVDFRAFVYCCMNALLHGIPSINVWGNTLKMEVFDAYVMGIPYAPFARMDKDRAKELLIAGLIQNRARIEDEPVKVGALDATPAEKPSPLAKIIVLPEKQSVQVGLDRW